MLTACGRGSLLPWVDSEMSWQCGGQRGDTGAKDTGGTDTASRL